MDFSYLEAYVGGDLSIAREVVCLFRQQAESWAPGLVESNPDWRALVHTIKGAARGIGAAELGELCHAAEFGEAAHLPPVREALAAVVADIAAYEAEKGG